MTGPADHVVHGAVFTADAARSWTDAVAIRGDRVVALGSAACREVSGPATEHHETAMVVPGFQDAHIHAPQAGLERSRLDLRPVHSKEDYLRLVADHAAVHPDAAWVLGGGWAVDCFPGGVPEACDLDRAVPDRPAYLLGKDGHTAWVNTTALRLAGVHAGTPDPAGGRYERYPDGEPTGALHEEAANEFSTRWVPAPTDEDWDAGIREAQRYLLSLGITGWQDAWTTPATLAAYTRLADRGELVPRVAAALWWERSQGLEQVAQFVEARARSTRPGLRPSSVKIMVDGVVENHTGALLEPYCSHPPTGNPDGMLHLEPGLLDEAVTRLDAAGFQVHMHAIGDRAARVALDSVQRAREVNGARGNRHHVAHVELVDPVDVPRFRPLDVVVNCQTYWAMHEPQTDEHTLPQLGQERFDRLYPFADLHRTGATLAMGSDWPVTTADPLQQMEVAITRRGPHDRDGDPLGPEQALPLAVVLSAFTAGSAYVNHDDDAGHLAVGRRADLVGLDRNLFDPDVHVADARVTHTLASGVPVYTAP